MKELIDNSEFEPKKGKTSCNSLFSCFKKKKEKSKVILDYVLRSVGKDLRKHLVSFKKNVLSSNSTEEKVESIYSLEKLYSAIQESLDNKTSHLFQINQINEKLKNEVDNYWEYFNIKKILSKQENKIKAQKKQLIALDEAHMTNDCIICMESERNVIFYPCLHLICCETCAFGKIGSECPECHTKIDNKQIAFT